MIAACFLSGATVDAEVVTEYLCAGIVVCFPVIFHSDYIRV